MSLILTLARRVLRTGAGRTALVILVLAATASVAMFGAASGRRAATAFDRFVDWSEVADITTGGYPGDVPLADLLPEAEALPQVEDSWRLKGLHVSLMTLSDGREIRPPRLIPIAFGEARAGRTIDRVKVLDGEMPAAADADQIVVDVTAAERFGLGVGEEITFVAEHVDQPLDPVTVRVAAVVSNPRSFPTIGGWSNAFVAAMPGFVEARPEWIDPWGESSMIHLRDGADGLDEFRTELSELGLGDLDLLDDLQATRDGANAVNRLEAVVSWAVAALAALTGLVVLVQLERRQATSTRAVLRTALALGVRRRDLVVAAALRGAAVGLLGAVVAAGAAILASPLAPVGIARDAEVDVGFHADWAVIASGVALMVLLGATAAAAAVATVAGSMDGVRRAPGSRWLDRAPARAVPTAVLVSWAGSRRRAGVLGISAAVALLLASLIVRTGMEGLSAEPERSGGSWDAFIGIEDEDVLPGAKRALQEIDVVDGVSQGGWSGFESNGVFVFSLILEPGSALEPAIVRGRGPMDAGEIALGSEAMQRLGVGLGDRLAVDLRPPDGESSAVAGTHQVEVVGEAIIGSTLFQEISPDDGAVMTPELAHLIEGDAEGAGLPFLVSFQGGVDPQDGLDLVHRAWSDDIAFSFARSERGDVRAIDEVGVVLSVLVLLIALVATASFAHQLVVATRTHRRDLAVLRALGAGRAGLVRTGAVAGATVACAVLTIGALGGYVVGTYVWRQVASLLVVLPVLDRPGSSLAAGLVIGMVIAAVLGALAVRSAVRARPAAALRTE